MRALLSTVAEIKTLEGRKMLVGLISSPVTDHTRDKLQKGIREIFLPLQGVFQKCIEYIGKFLIQMREILKFWLKVVCFRRNFRAHFRERP